MAYRQPARRRARRPRPTFLPAVAVVSALLSGVLVYQLLASSPASPQSPAPPAASPHSRASPSATPRIRQRDDDGVLGEADGAVPDGVTVFDDDVPGVANLDPDLLGALRQAATTAADAGVAFVVDSGWRSPAYQEKLRRETVAKYGSEEEAARWVAAPDKSLHVSGDAVDIGPSGAAAWLSQHGAAYGLCQIYGNEPWHFELRPQAVGGTCPPMYADPTQDPRLQG